MSIKKLFKSGLLILILLMAESCQNTANNQKISNDKIKDIVVGANQTEKYIALLKDKNIALVANHTSVIFENDKTNSDSQHLVDSLLSLKINILKVFAPEHGFRGTADAGEQISDINDPLTGLPIISLYGKKQKTSPRTIIQLQKTNPRTIT